MTLPNKAKLNNEIDLFNEDIKNLKTIKPVPRRWISEDH